MESRKKSIIRITLTALLMMAFCLSANAGNSKNLPERSHDVLVSWRAMNAGSESNARARATNDQDATNLCPVHVPPDLYLI
jgi:uncharacterized membrane-anchored protein